MGRLVLKPVFLDSQGAAWLSEPPRPEGRVCRDEPLLELPSVPPGETTQRIGNCVSRLVQDGDTIQVGYGGLPNAVMSNLYGKRHLGVHTELLGDGLVGGVTDSKPMLQVFLEGRLRHPENERFRCV